VRPPAVELRDVTLRRGRVTALDGFGVTVPEGTVVGLVGPNGAGKTSVVDVACGLLRPQRGEVRVFGHDVRRDGLAARRRIGLVPQETALYDEVSAWRNLRFAAELHGQRRPDGRIAELLELVGLTERASDPVATYSGGMRRRLAIARALVHEPSLLVLDEPTLGVDVEARHQVWGHVRGLRWRGHTVLISTNYLDEAEALCDRVVVLRAGRVVAEDTPAGLLARAGRSVDVECSRPSALQLRESLLRDPSVTRAELTESGLTLLVQREGQPEALVRRAMDEAAVSGFRVRPPDLAEVLRTIQ
jgi:ABC-2 type transport system ATP-binding protein